MVLDRPARTVRNASFKSVGAANKPQEPSRRRQVARRFRASFCGKVLVRCRWRAEAPRGSAARSLGRRSYGARLVLQQVVLIYVTLYTKHRGLTK